MAGGIAESMVNLIFEHSNRRTSLDQYLGLLAGLCATIAISAPSVATTDDAAPSDAARLVNALSKQIASFRCVRFACETEVYFQNSRQQRELISTARRFVTRDQGRCRLEMNQTGTRAPRSATSWEYLYTNSGAIEVCRDVVTGQFQRAQARLSPPDEQLRRSALQFEFTYLTDGTLPNNDLTVLELLARSRLTTARRRDNGKHWDVMTAISEWGSMEIWFDPERGHCPWRIVQTKRPNDICIGTMRVHELRNSQPGDDFSPMGILKEIVSRVEFDSFITTKRGWIPQFARAFCLESYEGGFWTAMTYQTKFTNIVIDPDFEPADFQLVTVIPNGSPITVLDRPGISFEWQDGKIVKSVNQPSVANLEGHWFQPGSWQKRALLLAGILVAAATAYWFLRRARKPA